jgi:hypothetical protein
MLNNLSHIGYIIDEPLLHIPNQAMMAAGCDSSWPPSAMINTCVHQQRQQTTILYLLTYEIVLFFSPSLLQF